MKRRKIPNAIYLKYDEFVADTEYWMRKIDKAIGIEPHVYDFENVENKATDCDALYNHKFPHNGSGKVEPQETSDWREFIPEDIAGVVMNQFQAFNKEFGYE